MRFSEHLPYLHGTIYYKGFHRLHGKQVGLSDLLADLDLHCFKSGYILIQQDKFTLLNSQCQLLSSTDKLHTVWTQKKSQASDLDPNYLTF